MPSSGGLGVKMCVEAPLNSEKFRFRASIARGLLPGFGFRGFWASYNSPCRFPRVIKRAWEKGIDRGPWWWEIYHVFDRGR